MYALDATMALTNVSLVLSGWVQLILYAPDFGVPCANVGPQHKRIRGAPLRTELRGGTSKAKMRESIPWALNLISGNDVYRRLLIRVATKSIWIHFNCRGINFDISDRKAGCMKGGASRLQQRDAVEDIRMRMILLNPSGEKSVPARIHCNPTDSYRGSNAAACCTWRRASFPAASVTSRDTAEKGRGSVETQAGRWRVVSAAS